MFGKKMYPTYFVYATLVIYIIFYLLPSFLGMGYSFTNWNVFSDEKTWVGLDNYVKAFSGEEEYMLYLGNTILFTVFTTFAKGALGLLFAVVLTKSIKGLNFHRAVLYLPSILSPLIVGLIFKSLLNPTTGLVNTILALLNITGPGWLTNPHLAFWTVMGVDIWKGTGYVMTIFIAGIMSIPETYYEAASIDGASPWQKFKSITLPMVMPSVVVTSVLGVIYGLKIFDLVYALTNGGPGFATEVMYTSIYKEFGFGRYAMGSTLSTIMFILMVVVGYFMIKAMTKSEVEE